MRQRRLVEHELNVGFNLASSQMDLTWALHEPLAVAQRKIETVPAGRNFDGKGARGAGVHFLPLTCRDVHHINGPIASRGALRPSYYSIDGPARGHGLGSDGDDGNIVIAARDKDKCGESRQQPYGGDR